MNNLYQENIYSFADLIHQNKIEIPIIQRDYAQGRIDKSELRNKFLIALRDSISANQEMQLDFIYGTEQNGSFQPLDGQQRLTTLFLLHWYAANKDNAPLEMRKEYLGNFTYETRITSRDFCEALVNNNIKSMVCSTHISDCIKNSNWFYLSWKKDPSIDAMLRTLDDIHRIFFTIDELWNKLIYNKLITFYYIQLEHIGLTDDLYIKMNARGKLLSPFENFKASLQKYIEENSWEKNKSPQDSFPHKIDTVWTDYFWKNFKKKDSIDEAFMRLIATVAMFSEAIERIKPNTEDRIALINQLNDEYNSIKPEYFSKTAFEYLINYFDIYCVDINDVSFPKITIPLWRHKPETSFINQIVFSEMNYSDRTVTASYSQKIELFVSKMQ